MKTILQNAKLFLFVNLFLFAAAAHGQNLTLTERGLHAWNGVLPYSSYTALFDENDQPFLYTANAQLGMITFDISDPDNPTPVDTLPTSAIGGLHVTNLAVHNNFVLLSAGGFAGFTQQTSSLAIVDVSEPTNPAITDQWIAEGTTAGAAVVVTNGTTACLGAMEDGVHILDISNVYNIAYLGTALPDPNFPEPPQGVFQPQARGLVLRNDTLFICNDSKGFRMFDLADPSNPVEIGKHINAAIYSDALPAYNEVVVLGDVAFVTVDYCGLEVIDISDTAMSTINHVDLWNCLENDWGCSEGHANQIRLVGDSLLFVSGADTELLVFSIADPHNPELLGSFGVYGDLSVSWGIGVRDNLIALANINFNYTCGLTIPYQSDWGGIQLLEWEADWITSQFESTQSAPAVFPVPAQDVIYIEWPDGATLGSFVLQDVRGTVVRQSSLPAATHQIDITTLAPGVWFLTTSISGNGGTQTHRIVVSP